jgi:gas vesicle protein
MMEHEENEYGTSTFTAFLLGLAAGAGLGLLLAPKSGQEAREKIMGFSRDAMERTRGTAHTMQNKARSMMKRGKEATEEKMESTTGTAPEEMMDPTYKTRASS